MSAIIETTNLTRRFGRNEAVRDLTFQVQPGNIYAFLGPNGAGKTTTIKTLLNILEPTLGSARILGIDSRKLSPREMAQIGYVSENQKLPEWMTVQQLLDYCRPFYPTWDESLCNQLIKTLSLPLNQKLRNLSRGMKVKAALVSSLAYLTTYVMSPSTWPYKDIQGVAYADYLPLMLQARRAYGPFPDEVALENNLRGHLPTVRNWLLWPAS